MNGKVLLLSLLPVAAAAQAPASYVVRTENTLTIARTDETIALPWSAVTQRLGLSGPAATAGAIRVRDAASGAEIPSQAVDNDGNGSIDELIFQASYAPGEAKKFVIERGAPSKPAAARVYASHQDPRDDVAWESDRIAYRTYGQGLWKIENLLSSGMDVWVKRVRTPIVEKWYAKEKQHESYHHDTGEGADFFDVGATLGAGAPALWRDGKLLRAWNFKSWRIIANGPVRAILELQYEPFDSTGLRVTETRRIALDAGQNLNHITTVFRTQSPAGGDFSWATGLVKRKSAIGSESKAQPWAWLSMWGPLGPKDGGHGDLGTAVVMPRESVLEWRETDDHYLAISHARSGEAVSYWAGAGWTDSGDFRDVRDWWAYLDQWAQRLATPVKVTVEP